jgi:hypothetical protein
MCSRWLIRPGDNRRLVTNYADLLQLIVLHRCLLRVSSVYFGEPDNYKMNSWKYEDIREFTENIFHVIYRLVTATEAKN